NLRKMVISRRSINGSVDPYPGFQPFVSTHPATKAGVVVEFRRHGRIHLLQHFINLPRGLVF
ncbi:MAG: hypothetical protein SWH68_01255, partial [Thermodesulfobacteriota bacterium]|nr:hypothetical protein [Thermodesulfobacteriota bacterium]